MRHIRQYMCAALTLAVISTVSVAASGPTETVRNTVQQILVILKDPTLGRPARWERIAPIINESFDFRSMSQSVLATRWESASPEQKRQFVNYFSEYLEATYRSKIEAYTDQSVEYRGEKVQDDRALVKTMIVSSGADIPVNYRLLRKEDKKWYAYDVVIEGVSLVNSYRTTFAAIEKTSGMQGVLNDVQRRIAKYRASQNSQTDAGSQ